MDPRLVRILTGAAGRTGLIVALLAGVATAGWVQAQEPGTTAPAAPATPPPPPGLDDLPQETPPPVITAPPAATAPEESAKAPAAAARPDALKAAEEAKPPEPPKPIRSPAAVIQALDKVTAETIRFEAPVGKRVRYKSLVFTVKACETTGIGDPLPKASAYLLIDSQPTGIPGRAPPPVKQVFKGWMFSTSPGLHPLEHPVYDAWLIACSASLPPA